MRTITIRQLQRKFYQEVLDLPVMITKLKKPLFVLMKAEDYDKIEHILASHNSKQETPEPKKGFLDNLLGK